MAKPLTIKTLEAIKPGPVRREIPDGRVTGLYHVVQPSGARSSAVRYRFEGKPRKHTIGSWPAVDLVTARDLASRALVAVAEGRDPAAEKKEARRLAGDGRAERDLVENIVDTFVERYAKANTREASWRETERILKREIVPAWRGRRIQDIKKRDVIEVLDRIVDRNAPVVANRTLARVRRMFGWLVDRGVIETSPCIGVKPPAAERSRDRMLSDNELNLLWLACEACEWPFGPLVQLLLLTAQRRDEVGEMRWSEIDLARKLWTIPRHRVKNDQEHEVPLSDQAVAILNALPRIKSRTGYVFTTTGDQPVSGFSRAKARIDAFMLSAMQEAAAVRGDDWNELAPLPHWTLHDLRRTAASGMARLGIQLPVIERILNHTSGSFAGIVGVYQRHSFSDEKRNALEAWGRFLDQLMTDEPAGNVVELATARG